MKVAQQLFEKGFITYHRTDSPRLSREAVDKIRKLISPDFGEKYLPKEARSYRAKEGAQDAHEAIRPVILDSGGKPEELKNKLNSAEFQLYSLIWKRTLASQMEAAEWDCQKLVFENEYGVKFYARGKVLLFEGWKKVYGLSEVEESENGEEGKEEKETVLPLLEKEEKLKAVKVDLKQKETKPPQRYSEATIVKWMEKTGVGRPSTYASTIQTLKKRGYVVIKDRKLHPTPLAYEVLKYLQDKYPWTLEVKFTAEVEKQLDLIEQGKLEWKTPVLEILEKLPWKMFYR